LLLDFRTGGLKGEKVLVVVVKGLCFHSGLNKRIRGKGRIFKGRQRHILAKSVNHTVASPLTKNPAWGRLCLIMLFRNLSF
jgi:uncharacterized Fe-S cluster protein YjdI